MGMDKTKQRPANLVNVILADLTGHPNLFNLGGAGGGSLSVRN